MIAGKSLQNETRRSSRRIKEGVTTVKDERGPGLDFALCFVYVCIKHIIKHMYQINAGLASIKYLFLKHNKFFLTLNF